MINLGITIKARRPRASNILQSRILQIIPTGITTLIIGDDMTVDMATIPARIGSAATPESSVRATKSTLNGRGAGLWSINAIPMGYRLAVSQKTQVAVATWAGPTNFPLFNGLVGGQDSYARLEGFAGNSIMLVDPPNVYRDGVLNNNVDASPHIWESTSATTTTASRMLGGLETSGGSNWVGPIAFCLQLSIQMSAQQRTDLVAVLKSYYSIA